MPHDSFFPNNAYILPKPPAPKSATPQKTPGQIAQTAAANKTTSIISAVAPVVPATPSPISEKAVVRKLSLFESSLQYTRNILLSFFDLKDLARAFSINRNCFVGTVANNLPGREISTKQLLPYNARVNPAPAAPTPTPTPAPSYFARVTNKLFGPAKTQNASPSEPALEKPKLLPTTHLQIADGTSEEVVLTLIKLSPNIKHLDFSKCSFVITLAFVQEICNLGLELTSLNLKTRAFEDAQPGKLGPLETFIHRCPKLKELHISDITNQTLQYIPESVETLSISGEDITDKGLAHLGRLTSLKKLSIFNTKITNAGVFHLKDFQLEQLVLHRCEEITFYAFADLKMSPLSSSLKTLSIIDCPYISNLLYIRKALRSLEQLVLRFYNSAPSEQLRPSIEKYKAKRREVRIVFTNRYAQQISPAILTE